MEKPIILAADSEITVKVTDFQRKPAVLIYLWTETEFYKAGKVGDNFVRRIPTNRRSLLPRDPVWRSGAVSPGRYILECPSLGESCFEITISRS
jgi:hypothetical protein